MVFRFWAYRTFVFRTAPAEEHLTGGEELAMALADATPSMAQDAHAAAHPAPGDRATGPFPEFTIDLDGAGRGRSGRGRPEPADPELNGSELDDELARQAFDPVRRH